MVEANLKTRGWSFEIFTSLCSHLDIDTEQPAVEIQLDYCPSNVFEDTIVCSSRK